MSFFDELDDIEAQVDFNDKPIWMFNLNGSKDKDDVLKWLNTEIDGIIQDAQARMEEVAQHVQLYKGVQHDIRQHSGRGGGDSGRINDRNTSEFSKMIINQLYELTEQKVSRLVKFRPGVEVLPTNDELGDKISSKFAKMVWEHVAYNETTDQKIQKLVRSTFIAGEAYFIVEWDEELGPLHPLTKKKGKKYYVDDDGKMSKDELPSNIRTGDVSISLATPLEVFFERVRKFEDADYYFRLNFVGTEELKLEYPQHKNEIMEDEEFENSLLSRYHDINIKNKSVVWEFVHRKTRGLPEGRVIKFTKDVILESGDLPNSSGKLPIIRFVDIEVPEAVHGRSFFINAKYIANEYNRLTSFVVRNQRQASHPKWFVPRGSVKLESLGSSESGITIVQYQGGQPPVLGQSNPTPAEVFTFRKDLRSDLEQVTGIHSVSRGQPPPGIKAGVALQFLDEQEQERHNSIVANFNHMIVQLAQKVLECAGDNYKDSDERTFLIMGKNDEWMAQSIDMHHISKSFAVRIQNSSSLPQSKSARIQRLIDIREAAPSSMNDEQFLDALDFAMPQSTVDVATAANRYAEMENDNLSEGLKLDPPEEYELHIKHWIAHTRFMQSQGFTRMGKGQKEKMKDHVLAHEYLMIMQVDKNPAYGEQLQTLDQFPMFFTPPKPPPMMGPEGPPPPGGPEGPVPPQAEAPPQGAEGVPPDLAGLIGQPEPMNPAMPPMQAGGDAPMPPGPTLPNI